MKEVYFKIKENSELPVAKLTYSYKDFDGVIHPFGSIFVNFKEDQESIREMERIKNKYVQFFMFFNNSDEGIEFWKKNPIIDEMILLKAGNEKLKLQLSTLSQHSELLKEIFNIITGPWDDPVISEDLYNRIETAISSEKTLGDETKPHQSDGKSFMATMSLENRAKEYAEQSEQVDLFTIPAVINRRELLISFIPWYSFQCKDKEIKEPGDIIDEFLETQPLIK